MRPFIHRQSEGAWRTHWGAARLLALLLASLLATACRITPVAPTGKATTGEPATLNVFAAASLKEAFEAIGADFQSAHPGAHVVFNFAGSQQLAQQINAGAPADVFASADQRQMQTAIDGGRIDAQAPAIFAGNRLVVVFPPENPGGLTVLADLAKPGLKVVLADASVPAGRYAREFLANASLTPDLGATYGPAVLDNVASFEENVRSVLNKVVLGEADAGIVYQSDAAAAADSVEAIAIPDDLNVIAAYPIATLEDSPHAALAKAFVAAVLSEPGQRVLIDHGFMPAEGQ